MVSINTNLSGLISQNSLKSSSLKLNQAIERMTTGYKINHASDNAANYSIATNMTTKIGAYMVAEDNALQGIEMMSSSLESLNHISDKLNRMRALAVQTQNGTYGGQSLNAINAEAKALLGEVTRINESATYNGIKLFNTGKMDVTNAGKELELNEQGFLQDVVKVDTTGMTKLSSVDPNATLAVGEYSISTVEELAQLATMANAGLLESGSTFTLANDIDLEAWCRANEANGGWIPIGNSTNYFQGTFNGNGYEISNLYINNSSWTIAVGLFGNIINSTVKDVKILNVDITGHAAASALAGVANSSMIKNSVVTGAITGNNIYNGYTGAISGNGTNSKIYDCYANISIYSKGRTIGGIVGSNGEVYSSYVEGSIIGEAENVGGIVGSGKVQGSKCIATVKGTSVVGGIAGSNGAYAPISDVYFKGNVIGDNNIGGIIGNNWQTSATITDVIFEGELSGNSNVGILLGSQAGNDYTNIKDSFYYSEYSLNNSLIGNEQDINLSNIINLAIPCDYTLQIASCGDDARSTLSYTTYIDFSELNSVLSSGIENADTIEKIDNLVNIVAMKQTELGTAVNRLESVLEEINIQYENLVSSRSTILDADMAEVSSDYIRQQILQQASATLMSTANQSPSIALQLI